MKLSYLPVRGDGIIAGQDWSSCSQAQCAHLATHSKHIPVLPQSHCESELAGPVNLLTLEMSLGLLSSDHHHNSPFSHFIPPQSGNSSCAASGSVRAESHLSLVIYLFQAPVFSDKLWAAGLWEKHRNFQYTQQNVLWKDWSSLLALSCSQKWHFPQVIHMLFHSICWIECGDEGQSLYSLCRAWEILDCTCLSLPSGGKNLFFFTSVTFGLISSGSKSVQNLKSFSRVCKSGDYFSLFVKCPIDTVVWLSYSESF